MSNRPVAVIDINDCAVDSNGDARLFGRIASLFPGSPIKCVGIRPNDLTLGGMLLDAIDSLENGIGKSPAIILGNSAPRLGMKGNGGLFASFWVGPILVVTTTAGHTLSFLKHVGLVETSDVRVYDTRAVVELQLERKSLKDREMANHMANNQFRSFSFQPYLARWCWDRVTLPSQDLGEEIPDLPTPTVPWWCDEFGNIKLAGTAKDRGFEKDQVYALNTASGKISLPYRKSLSQVPDGEMALVTGSSGYEDHRWLEVVAKGVKGPSARERMMALSTGVFSFSLE